MADDGRDCSDVAQAVEAEQQAETPDKARRKEIIAKALERGCVEAIPDDWGIEVHHGGGNQPTDQ